MEVGVEVWAAELDGSSADVGLLHESERERAERFAFDHLRRRYTVAHAMLRSVLGVGPEAALEAGPHGKPALTGGPHFNLSHSGGLAVVAVCRAAPVGVDVEAVRPLRRLRGLAERVMSAEELSAFERARDPERFFFELWTRKEAVVKAIGEGIIRELRSLSYEGLTVQALDVGPGYAAALAVEGSWPELQVRVHAWP